MTQLSQWPSDLVGVLQENCRLSGLVNRAALSFETGEAKSNFVVSLDVKHQFLFQKLAESLKTRVSPDYAVEVESWGPEIEKMVSSNPECIFFRN